MSRPESVSPVMDHAMAATRRLRICFVAQNGFGALSGRATAHSGGVERQSSLWARWFAARGHGVRFVTWDVGQNEDEVAGVSVLKLCRRDQGVPGLRFFHPRWTSLVRALARADADVYHYMSGNSTLGQMALWCRRNGRALTYYVSSSWAAERALPHLNWREKVFYRFGLRNADRVMVQTSWQQAMLRENFGVEATLVPMPCEEPTAPASGAGSGRGGTRVLWVGRYSREKRLEWLLELAEACPELQFDVAGAANESSPYAAGLTRRGQSLPNVTLHGRIDDPEMLAQLYRSASVLCCTSESEGFPNTFLEAWSHGLPVVTTIDPGGIVARLGLGAAAHDVSSLRASLRELLGSPEGHARISQNARRYYLENHRPASVLPGVERIFVEACVGR